MRISILHWKRENTVKKVDTGSENEFIFIGLMVKYFKPLHMENNRYSIDPRSLGRFNVKTVEDVLGIKVLRSL